ncbi:Mitogen-activated protein kinase kinase kinase 15 [Myotis brandtii]|uniref:Mitogen-activated protein kinase kinase kinase 15 n=1 Tax=Myotis brandtii TaxID=109478 RepID=S7N0U0_MYOBR|nr:Mitogen-activated protein kinase kinase kinase 15 [Myotis brandtii]
MATEAEPEKPEEAAPSKEGQDQQQRSLRAVYICNESPEDRKASGPGPEEGALKCLVQACEAQGAFLSTVRFGELDFKETAVLHAFYHAGEADIPFTPSPVPFLSASLTIRSEAARAPPHPSTLDFLEGAPGPWGRRQ